MKNLLILLKIVIGLSIATGALFCIGIILSNNTILLTSLMLLIIIAVISLPAYTLYNSVKSDVLQELEDIIEYELLYYGQVIIYKNCTAFPLIHNYSNKDWKNYGVYVVGEDEEKLVLLPIGMRRV